MTSGALSDSNSDEEKEQLPDGCGSDALKRFTLSERFALTAALVICVNVVGMIVQADYPRWQVCSAGPETCVDMWLIVNTFFLAFYMIELFLRFMTFGVVGFLCHKEDWSWNWFDFIIVTSGVLDVVMKLALQSSHGGGKLIVVIRVMRILRVLRVLRLFRQFKKLRLLIRGLMESVTGVFWLAVMIVAILFISAIFCTFTIGQNAAMWEDKEAVEKYFGSVARSMFTLFQFMTLDDWNSVDTMITQVMPWMQAFFFTFLIFAAFVILSLLTGLMADHMNHVREAEEEEESKKITTEEQLAVWEEAFGSTVDANGVVRVDRKQFAGIFANQKLSFNFAVQDLKMTEEEAEEIFPFFDLNSDGWLSFDEFMLGLEEYRKQLTMRDITMVQHVMTVLHRQVLQKGGPPNSVRSEQPSPAACSQLEQIDQKLEAVNSRIGAFDAQLAELKQLLLAPSGDNDES